MQNFYSSEGLLNTTLNLDILYGTKSLNVKKEVSKYRLLLKVRSITYYTVGEEVHKQFCTKYFNITICGDFNVEQRLSEFTRNKGVNDSNAILKASQCLHGNICTLETLDYIKERLPENDGLRVPLINMIMPNFGHNSIDSYKDYNVIFNKYIYGDSGEDSLQKQGDLNIDLTDDHSTISDCNISDCSGDTIAECEAEKVDSLLEFLEEKSTKDWKLVDEIKKFKDSNNNIKIDIYNDASSDVAKYCESIHIDSIYKYLSTFIEDNDEENKKYLLNKHIEMIREYFTRILTECDKLYNEYKSQQ